MFFVHARFEVWFWRRLQRVHHARVKWVVSGKQPGVVKRGVSGTVESSFDESLRQRSCNLCLCLWKCDRFWSTSWCWSFLSLAESCRNMNLVFLEFSKWRIGHVQCRNRPRRPRQEHFSWYSLSEGPQAGPLRSSFPVLRGPDQPWKVKPMVVSC